MSMLAQHIRTAIHSHFSVFDKTLVTLNITVFLMLITVLTHLPNSKQDQLIHKTEVLAATTYHTITVTPQPFISPTETPNPTATNTPSPTATPPALTPTPTHSIQSIPTITKHEIATNPEPSRNSAQSLLDALNAYRQKKGKHTLTWDSTLAVFAQSRADTFEGAGALDNHAGFQNMMNDNGFEKMGFWTLGENSGWTDNTDSVYIIESLYGGHGPHDENQLESKWTHVGIGIKGAATDFVFGGNKR